MNRNKKYLSDVLSAQELLTMNKQKICIISGVGSGKNYFVTHELAGHGNMMYVSSRRAKVNELLNEEICNETINWDDTYNNEVFTTTNYGIELLVKNQRFSTTGINNIKEHFSMVVIDEVHSIATDSTFADSAFHLHSFIEHIAAECPDTKIIVMTGTPEPVQGLLKKEGYTIIDKREECIDVCPKQVSVISKDTALKLIKNLSPEQKTIYYTNSTGSSIWGKTSLFRKLTEKSHYNENEIAFAIADSKAKVIMRKPGNPIEDLDIKTKETKEYISEKHELPEGVRLLIATSTLKEGVNIESTDVKIAFCESHILSDIQQFAGRVRAGLDVLYIVSEGRQFSIADKEMQKNLIEFSFDFNMVAHINEYLENTVKNSDSFLYKTGFGGYDANNIDMLDYFFTGDWSVYNVNDAAKYFIDSVEDKFKYIRFNHLKNQFELFPILLTEENRINQYFSRGWEKAIRAYCAAKGIKYRNSTSSKEVNVVALAEKLECCLGKKIFTVERGNPLLRMIAEEFGFDSLNPKRTTCNKALSNVGIPFYIDDGITSRGGKKVRYCIVRHEDSISSDQ